MEAETISLALAGLTSPVSTPKTTPRTSRDFLITFPFPCFCSFLSARTESDTLAASARQCLNLMAVRAIRCLPYFSCRNFLISSKLSEVISAIGIDPGRMTGKPEVGVRRLGSCREKIVPGALFTKHSCSSKVLGGMSLIWRSGGSSLRSQHSLKFSNSSPHGCELWPVPACCSQHAVCSQIPQNWTQIACLLAVRA